MSPIADTVLGRTSPKKRLSCLSGSLDPPSMVGSGSTLGSQSRSLATRSVRNLNSDPVGRCHRHGAVPDLGTHRLE